MAAIEKNLHDVLNAGLGLFQTVQGRIDLLQKDIVSSFEGLVTRGAADKGGVAEKIRETVDQGFNAVRDFQVKSEGSKKGAKAAAV